MVNNWDKVLDYLPDAKAIAWDTCHKIYILMDDEQVALMREYEYDPLITKDQMSTDRMYDTVVDWYETSCGLRFIDAVYTHPTNPNEGFTTLIGQFEKEDCEDCGESGCSGVCNDYEEDEEEED